MKNEKICKCCGSKVVEYKHGLSKGLVKCLHVIARKERMRHRGDAPINLNDLGLTYNQQSNFQKLRYWGLVEKADLNSKKGGEWFITPKGMRFIMGEIMLQQYAWTFRAQITRFEGKWITIEDVAEGYRYRPHYAVEAVAHETVDLLF